MSRKRKTPGPARPAAAPPPASERRAAAWLGYTACGAVVALAFVFGFHKLDDFDTWWHLAAGRWMVTHHAIPATDTLSHTVRDHPWTNLQWGFDVGLYLLHRAGGATLLSLLTGVVFAVTTALVVRLIAREIGTGFAALLGLVVVIAAQERITLRPELLTFLLLAAVLSVIDYGKRSDGRGLFMLVPLMVIWTNVHALFVIGAFAIACAMLSGVTAASRRLFIWGGAALASVVINPFGLWGALFPLTLMSRIDGSNPVFQIVGEFRSPFAPGATEVSIVAYKVLLAAAGLTAIAALVAGRRREWGSVVFVAGLAWLSISARRNVALFAIGSAPFVAQWLSAVLTSRLRVRGPSLAAIGASIGALFVMATVVTGAFYRFDNSPQEFGAGVIEGTFPIRAAAFARAAALPGKLYNDMGAGGYLAWDDPIGDGVFIDGRLEVYDTAFVTEVAAVRDTPSRWQPDADRRGIQTAIIFHRFEPLLLLVGRISRDPAWTLVYADEVAVIFVRTQGNEAAIARAASLRPAYDAETEQWLSRPIGSWQYPAGRIEGTRAYARMLATIGRPEPAIAAYLKLFELGIPPKEEVDRRLLVARYFASRGRVTEAREQIEKILAIDPGNADARQVLK